MPEAKYLCNNFVYVSSIASTNLKEVKCKTSVSQINGLSLIWYGSSHFDISPMMKAVAVLQKQINSLKNHAYVKNKNTVFYGDSNQFCKAT